MMEHSCPGSKMQNFKNKKTKKSSTRQESELRQWPIQLHLVSPGAPYFEDSNLLLVADCVPFANANFHQDYLKERPIAIACPKLDDTSPYIERLAEIINQNNVKSLTVLHMEVPCCFGLNSIAEAAISTSGKNIPLKQEIITIQGEKQ
jgi:hypothetical protein